MILRDLCQLLCVTELQLFKINYLLQSGLRELAYLVLRGSALT